MGTCECGHDASWHEWNGICRHVSSFMGADEPDCECDEFMELLPEEWGAA